MAVTTIRRLRSRPLRNLLHDVPEHNEADSGNQEEYPQIMMIMRFVTEFLSRFLKYVSSVR